MLKNKLFTSILACASALAFVAPVVPMAAHAATPSTSTSANKSVEVKLTAGTTGFTSDGAGNYQVPSFGFGTHQVSGQAQMGLTQSDNNNRVDSSDTYKGSILSVTNLGGNAKEGYTVTAQLGDMIGASTHEKLDGAVLHMNADGPIVKSTVDQKKLAPNTKSVDLTAGGPASSAIIDGSDAAHNGQGIITTDLKDSKLDVPNADYADDYVAPLTYTLTSVPLK